MSEHASVPLGGEALSTVAGPPGIDTLHGLVVKRMLLGGLFGPGEDAIVVFEDGTYTSDLSGVFGDGVATSRANEPQR